MESKEKIRTDFLIKERTFWIGFSSILCLFGDPYKFNTSKSGAEADAKAISSDWQMIGKDFLKALQS